MEEDIPNYSPTVMFRGTPCTMFEPRLMFFEIWPQETVNINWGHLYRFVTVLIYTMKILSFFQLKKCLILTFSSLFLNQKYASQFENTTIENTQLSCILDLTKHFRYLKYTSTASISTFKRIDLVYCPGLLSIVCKNTVQVVLYTGSHETESLNVFFLITLLHIKDFLQFIPLSKSFTQIYFIFEINFTII